jgi:hypothetical protein
MNERINGLWWKAQIGYNNQNCDPEVLEKFAELIVRECADELLKWKDEPFPFDEDLAVRLIKDHFGVEK